MTIQRFPSAIYRCDLPVSSAGAIYSSSVNTRERRRTHSSHPPIPAWPDIKSTDQWCCLPGLWRAIFTYGKDQDLDYGPQLQYLLNLSHKYGQEVVNEAIKFYQLPPSDRRNASNAVIYLAWSAQWWDLAQGEGFNGAFSCQHEVGHRLVGAQGVYCSIQQAAWALTIKGLLKTIATTPQLSPNDLRQLWHEFFDINTKLCDSVQRFRVVEETVANVYALLFIPIDIEDPVFHAVYDELMARIDHQGYLPFFNAFFGGCEVTLELIWPLMELFTILFDRGLSQGEALLKSIAALESVAAQDARPSLEDVDRWVISAYPSLEPLLTAVINYRRELFASELWYPIIGMAGIGNYADIVISNSEEIAGDCISESLRQQISNVCGLTCPLRIDNEPCCGRQDFLRTLWERLPRNYRSVLRPPTCGNAG